MDRLASEFLDLLLALIDHGCCSQMGLELSFIITEISTLVSLYAIFGTDWESIFFQMDRSFLAIGKKGLEKDLSSKKMLVAKTFLILNMKGRCFFYSLIVFDSDFDLLVMRSVQWNSQDSS